MVSVVVRNQKESRRIYLEVIEGDQERLRRKEDEMMTRHGNGRPRKRRPGRLEGTADEKKRLLFLHFYKPEVVHVTRNSSVVRTCKVQLWKMSQTRGLHCFSWGMLVGPLSAVRCWGLELRLVRRPRASWRRSAKFRFGEIGSWMTRSSWATCRPSPGIFRSDRKWQK